MKDKPTYQELEAEVNKLRKEFITHKTLEKENILLKSIFNQCDLILFSLDKNYCYLSFNENHFHTIKKIWNIEISLGMNMLDLISLPADRKKAKIDFDIALAGESITRMDEYGDEKFSRSYYEDSYSPLKDSNGYIYGLFGSVKEITEQKKAQEDIKRLNTELTNKNKELNAINEELLAVNLTISKDRKQFLSILDSIPEHIYVSDIDTNKILFANKKIKELIGRDITGEICYKVLHEKSKACLFCTNEKIQNTDTPHFWEFYNPNLDKHFYIMDRKIKWTDNKDVRFELAIDISRQKQDEQVIKESEEKLNIAIENANMGIMFVAKDGNILYANKVSSDIFGYSNNELIALSVNDLTVPEDKNKSPKFIKSAIEDNTLGKAVFEKRYFHKNGHIINCEVSSALLHDKNHKPLYFISHIKDITGQKAAEEALRESEEKFRTLFEVVPALLDAFDEKGKCILWNNECEKVFGWTKDEINSYDHPLALFYPDPVIQQQATDSITSKPNKVFSEWHPMTKDKEELTVLWANVKLNNGIVVNIGHNITALKKSELALKKSEEKYRLITENATDVIWIYNLTQQQYTYISPSVFTLRGYTPEEAMSHGIDGSVTPELAKIVKDEISQVLPQFLANPKEKSNTILRHEWQQPCKNGDIIWIESDTRFQYNSNNEIEIIGISRNIDKRKKLDKMVINQNEELKELNATKDRFISILGHDLKTPFNALLGFSDLLLEDIDGFEKEEIKEYVGYINKASKQTYNLLNNLLEWSQSQRGQINFDPELVDLCYLIQENFLLLNNTAKAKKIQVKLELLEQINIWVDIEMIKAVIRNLLSNAIKFTPESGTITIAAKKTSSTAQISITDTGTGMDEKTISSLFKIGEIKSLNGTNGEVGTGFGLLLCNEFVNQHKGKISIESELNKGTTFTVTLPLNT